MRNFLWLTGCTLAYLSVGVGVMSVGPDLEARFFSPVKDVTFSNIDRQGRSVCWDLNLRKVRNIAPVQSFYAIETGARRREVVVTLGNDPISAPVPVEFNPDKIVTLGPFCMELPTIRDKVVIDEFEGSSLLRTVIVYRPHFLWDFLIDHPPMLIPKQPRASQ